MTASFIPIPLRLSKFIIGRDMDSSHISSLASGSRVQACKQSRRRISQRFHRLVQFLFVCLLHANNKAWSGKHEVQKNSATGAWKHEQR